MKRGPRPILIAIAAWLFVAVGVPFAELWYKCREPASEGCVWGKALLPVSLAVCAVLGLGAAALAYFIARALRQGRTPRP